MKKFILIAIAMLGMAAAASAAEYAVNDADIDALVENAIEAPATVDLNAEFSAVAPATPAAPAAAVSGKSDVAATVICFFLGGFGIHRHYMGTAPWMWAAYTFTVGGIFGIIPTIDFIIMLIDDCTGAGLGEFYGNRKFFMWA